MTTADIHTDEQYREVAIREVATCEGGWNITDEEGWSLFVTGEACAIPPDVGERVRMYGRGLGYTVRGVVIGERVYRYQTEAESRNEHATWSARMKAERAAKYESARDEYDARVSALPAPLKDRIQGFRAFGGDEWRHEFEPYELFVCEQAAAFASKFGTVEAIDKFCTLPHANQRIAVPEMSDEHSGNTFGAAVTLAKAMILTPELVDKMHGALCPLVGCREYGCPSVRETGGAA